MLFRRDPGERSRELATVLDLQVGETNDRGEEPALDPVTPNDFQATLYRYFGIPLDAHFTDRTGPPIPILPEGRPIRRLVE